MIPLPYKIAHIATGSVYYQFRLDDFPNKENDGQYYVRGAICWPQLVTSTTNYIQSGDAVGHIIVAAQKLKSPRIVIFKDTLFRNIEHIVEDNNMVAEGLVSWLNAVWGILGCRTYFYTANYETHKQFLLQTLRSEMLEPKPYFIHIPNISTEDCMNILYHYRAAGKIVMSADSQIAQDLLAWEQTERKIEMPSVRALMNLVAGFERYPFSPNFVEGE